MNFFAQQESIRDRKRWLVGLFALFAIPSLFFFSVLTVFLLGWLAGYTPFEFMEDLWHGHDVTTPMIAGAIATVVIAAALLAYKIGNERDVVTRIRNDLCDVQVSSQSTDPLLRQLFNVSEEMALAAGIPAPGVYLWNSTAINSLTLGSNAADSMILVTRGAVDSLSRDEMQALIGYGMAQIVNGDISLNSRLASFLFIYDVTPAAALYLCGLPVNLLMPLGPQVATRLGGILLVPWLFTGMVPAFALAVLSLPPYVFGRIIRWIVLRQGKVGADASALQFTRDPPALRDLLVKTLAMGSYIKGNQQAFAGVSHACFAPLWSEWFSIYPKLENRIRALDPGFDLFKQNEIGRMQRSVAELRRHRENKPPAPPAPPAVRQRERSALIERIGAIAAGLPNSQPAAVPTAVAADATVARTAMPVPEQELTEITTPADARAVLLALLVDRKPATETRQMEGLRELFGPQSIESIQAASRNLLPVQLTERTLALDMHLPALRGLPAPELRRLQRALSQLRKLDDLTDVFEYSVSRVADVFITDILSARAPHGSLTLVEGLADVHLLLSVVAQSGGGNAARAYAAGMRSIDPERRFEFAAPVGWTRKLDTSLERLDQLQPLHKELLLDALSSVIAFDREVTPGEHELVRAVAASLHCPLPRDVLSTRAMPVAHSLRR